MCIYIYLNVYYQYVYSFILFYSVVYKYIQIYNNL